MIYSERLCFRPFKEDEFDEMKEILGNPNVCEYLPGSKEKSDEEIKKWLAFFVKSFNDSLGNKIYAICLKDSGEVIGYGGLGYVKEFEQIEIMYGLKESDWGNGYATEV
jgi:RimJ/RimL family protein N-acetyltransferase